MHIALEWCVRKFLKFGVGGTFYNISSLGNAFLNWLFEHSGNSHTQLLTSKIMHSLEGMCMYVLYPVHCTRSYKKGGGAKCIVLSMCSWLEKVNLKEIPRFDTLGIDVGVLWW